MPKKYVPLKRGKTRVYQQNSLEKAVKAVESGLSVRQAAKQFNIPKSTIGDRVSGRLGLNSNHGRPPALSPELESKIVSSIKMAAKLGVGLSQSQILRRTKELCSRLDIQSGYSNFHAGKDWFAGLKRRYPELVLRKPEKLTSVRARMLNPEVLGKYFDALFSIITEGSYGEHPERVWNCDETGFNMEHDPVRVYAEKGDRSVVSKVSTKSSNLTVMACVNAKGSRMPPMIITKGKTTRSIMGFRTEDAPEGSVWTFQKNGWISDEIGERWFNDVFLKHCGPERPQLLLLDGHGSHETLAIIERAMEESITLMVFPPHCTHFLQPLDRTVFGPLKSAYNDACSSYLTENPLNQVSKHTFSGLFTRAWDSAVTCSNIQAGFRACGIFPFNPRAVPMKACDPSKLTNVSSTVQPTKPATSTPVASPENIAVANGDMLIATPISESASTFELLEQQQNSSFEMIETTLPVLDLSDPQLLFDFISCGTTELQTDIAMTDSVVHEVSVGSVVDSIFLPPELPERPVLESKRQTCKSHKLLTSEDVLREKRLKLEKNSTKTTKTKKIKKEK